MHQGGQPVVFVYKRDGKPYGFNAETSDVWAQRISSTKDTDTTILFDAKLLKDGLRKMVKEKRARLIKAGPAEGVLVQHQNLSELLYGKRITTEDIGRVSAP